VAVRLGIKPISKPDAIFAVEEVRLDEDGQVHHSAVSPVIIPGGRRGNRALLPPHGAMTRAINMRLHSPRTFIDMAVDQLGLDLDPAPRPALPTSVAVEYSGTWEPDKAENLRTQIEARTNGLIEKVATTPSGLCRLKKAHHLPPCTDNIPKNKPGRVVVYAKTSAIPAVVRMCATSSRLAGSRFQTQRKEGCYSG